MFTKLFHSEVYLPIKTQEVCKELQQNLNDYFFSRHFEEHLENQIVEDRSHTYLKDVIVECINSLKTRQQPVFEVELGKDYHYFKKPGWFVTKYCCRIKYSEEQDLVVAIRPQYTDGKYNGNNMIVTAWMNSREDNHYTLDRTKYCSREEWNNITNKR